MSGPNTHVATNGEKKHIVYVLGTYPDLTTTFIDREVAEARRVGTKLTLIAVSRPASAAFGVEVRGAVPVTKYVLPTSMSKLFHAHWRYLRNKPRRYLSTLAYLLTRPHSSLIAWVKTIVHFAEGIVATELLRDMTPAHVHAHFADRAAVVAIVISRMLGIPYSITAHAYDIYRSPVFLKDKIQGAVFTSTCTAFNKSYLERETGCPVELIYHGLNIESSMDWRDKSRSAATPLILSVGRLQEKKGFADLIRACQSLRSQGRSFICEIIGEGPERPVLERLIREFNLAECVTLAGARSRDEVQAKYSEASVFVLPCVVAESGDRDGIPNVILEAMIAGVPVVSTNVSGVPEVVRHLETGYLGTPRRPEELAGLIWQVLEAPQRAASIATNAHALVTREFDIRVNVIRLLQLLDSRAQNAES